MTVALSVLMPVHNTAQFLPQALRSIGKQTFRDFELIVLDDGSTDGSNVIAQEFARHEPRARVVVRSKKGLIDTRNELLAEAQAPLVAWMDSDDVAVPNRLELQVHEFAERPQLVCLGGNALCIDPGGQPLKHESYPQGHERIVERQRSSGAFRFPTVTMRTDAARAVGGFRHPFVVGEDFDLLQRLSEVGELDNLPDVLLLYRLHLGSVSVQQWQRWWPYRDVILALAEERRAGRPDALQRGETLTIDVPTMGGIQALPSDVQMGWARDALAHGYGRSAWKHAWGATSKRPTRLRTWKTLAQVAWGWAGAPPPLALGAAVQQALAQTD